MDVRTEERRRRILDTLAEMYPDAKCELNFTTPFELLVATILSAQSTDKRVNMVTARLFPKYNTPEDFAALPYETLEAEIREIGLYRSKAKNIIEMSRRLLQEHDGQVPADREALEKLPGVGTEDGQRGPQQRFWHPGDRGRHPRLSRRQPPGPRLSGQDPAGDRTPAHAQHSQGAVVTGPPLADPSRAKAVPCSKPQLRGMPAPFTLPRWAAAAQQRDTQESCLVGKCCGRPDGLVAGGYRITSHRSPS